MIRECGLHAYRARECVGVNAFSRGESAQSGSECEVRRAAARLLLREERVTGERLPPSGIDEVPTGWQTLIRGERRPSPFAGILAWENW